MRKSEVEHRHIRYVIDGQKHKEAFIFSTQLVITHVDEVWWTSQEKHNINAHNMASDRN